MANLRSIGKLSQKYIRINPTLKHLSKIKGLIFFGYAPRHNCLLWWTDNLEEILGVSDQKLIRNADLFLRHTHENDRFHILSELQQALQGNKEYRVSYRWIMPNNNQCRWLHCRAALRVKSEQPIFEGVIFDISEEQNQGIFEQDSICSNQSILDSMAVSAFILDLDLRFRSLSIKSQLANFYVQGAALTLQEPSIGKQFLDCLKNDQQNRFFKELFNTMQERQVRVTKTVEQLQIDLVPIQEKYETVAYLMQFTDISGQTKANQQLSELVKAENTRAITASVLHNVTNSLQTMVGELRTLKQHKNDTTVVNSISDSLLARITRLSLLSQQARNLEKQSSELISEIDLNLCLLMAIQQVQKSVHFNTKIAMNFGNPPLVFSKQNKMIASLAELIGYAKNFIPNCTISVSSLEENDKAVINIKAKKLTEAGNAPSTQTVTDVDRSYEVKETINFIKKLDGQISIKSNQQKLLVIQISLPRSSDKRKTVSGQSESIVPEIILVDDDALVLDCLHAMCQDLGYPCVLAQNGLDAIRLAKRHQQSLKVALVDGLLPGINGAAITKKLKANQPDLQVIGISGAPADVCQELEEAGALKVLNKPISLQTLKTALEQVLDKRQVIGE